MNRRLITEAGPARAHLAGTMVAGLAITGLILAQAGLLADVLSAAATGTGVVALRVALAALAVVALTRALAAYASEATALRAAAIVKERLRTRLLRHSIGLGPAWLSRQGAGEVTALATSGLDALDPYFARYLPQVMLAGSVPLAVLTAVASADWLSGLIIAVTLPLIPIFGALVGLHTKAQTQRSWQLLARLSGHFLDVVQGLPTLKVFGRAKAQEKIIEAVTGEYRASVMATLRVAFLSALVLELSASLATALVAVEVGLRLLYGHMSYPTALFVLLLTPEAYLPLRNVAASFHASADGTAAARRAYEILDQPLPGPGHGPARTPGQVRRSGQPIPDLRTTAIALDRVTVRYPGRPVPVLDNASVTIHPGDQLTVIGPNGAGKSTLLSLLLRFVEPAGGTVRAGNRDVATIPLEQWRRQVCWLPQHPALFAWSVADNIAIGAPGASRARIEHAAELAGADGFIAGLPHGYDTVLDERALRLSSGERRKVALARLFLRDAPLVLLDEPTAHLDPVSVSELSAAVRTLLAGRTVVEVTHATADGEPVTVAAGRRVLLVGQRSIREHVADRCGTAGQESTSTGSAPVVESNASARSEPGVRPGPGLPRTEQLADASEFLFRLPSADRGRPVTADDGSGPGPERAQPSSPEPGGLA